MFEDLTWYLPILKRNADPKYIKKFRDTVSSFVRHHEELFDENTPLPDPGTDVSGLDGRTAAALAAAAVREGDECFTDGRVIGWLTRLNEIDIQNGRRDMIMLTVRSSSGYCLPEYVYSDEITVTRDWIRYTCKPGIPSDKNPELKWSYRLTGPVQQEIYEELVTTVIEILHRGAASGMFDVGTRSFTVTYADGTEEERDFFLSEFAFRDCFDQIKKLIPPDEAIPRGIRTREDEENEKNRLRVDKKSPEEE